MYREREREYIYREREVLHRDMTPSEDKTLVKYREKVVMHV